MSRASDWFAVDREGLAKLVARKGKEFVIFELLQNAWDTRAKKVEVSLRPVEGRPLVELSVQDDDPEGFQDIAHAWTLFAESRKKANPEKRGRFNLGEKLVLALCTEAVISTTTGSVIFNKDGRRRGRVKRKAGSEFFATLRMSREEYEAVVQAVRRLLPPEGVWTAFNDRVLPVREALTRIQTTLPTEIADEEGVLRRTARKTWVDVHETLPGEKAFIYEMGIPVVETGDRWHYNIGQKVPLNADRDNVTPAYLQEVRAEVLNAMHARLSADDATAKWVRDASADPSVRPAALDTVMTLRFGQKRVVADPTDPEGTKLAMSQGYTVVPGGSLSGGEWANVKRDGSILPAGQVTPSPKPFSADGQPLKLLTDWSEGMERVAKYVHDLGYHLINRFIEIRYTADISWGFTAAYGDGVLTINKGRLGNAWFDALDWSAVDRLMLHELAHEYTGDHLSEKYHDALCLLGAKLAAVALEHPELFENCGRATARERAGA